MNGIPDFAQLFHGAASRLTVRSALNPMLWLSAISAAIFLTAAYAFKDQPFLCHTLALVAIVPTVVTCCLAIYFAFCKPDKLQSEEFQIRAAALQLVQKGKFSRELIPILQGPIPPEHQIESDQGKGPKPGVDS